MNAQQFCKWQKARGWNNERTAQELRMSKRQVINYRVGKSEISDQFALLCELVAKCGAGAKKLAERGRK